MDKLRAMRDSLEKGDTVLVNWPGGMEGLKKPRRATVREVMRGAARVVFEDDHVERAVQFKYITKYEEEIVPAPIAPPRIASILQLPTKQPDPTPPDDVQAWLDMGATLIAQLEVKMTAAELNAAALEADSKALMVECEREKHEVASIKDKLKKLRDIAGRK